MYDPGELFQSQTCNQITKTLLDGKYLGAKQVRRSIGPNFLKMLSKVISNHKPQPVIIELAKSGYFTFSLQGLRAID